MGRLGDAGASLIHSTLIFICNENFAGGLVKMLSAGLAGCGCKAVLGRGVTCLWGLLYRYLSGRMSEGQNGTAMRSHPRMRVWGAPPARLRAGAPVSLPLNVYHLDAAGVFLDELEP